MPNTTSSTRAEASIAASRAILLTPAGTGAIAVVRLCGPLVPAFLNGHFSRRWGDGRCVHGELRDGGAVIDDIVLVTADEGTIADLNLHGGPWIVRRTLELAGRFGFELLPTGAPLPKEAIDAETEIEREALAWLPLARTEPALRILSAQPRIWAGLKKASADEIRRMARRIADDRSLFWLLNLPRVAIIGLPNVGKSTLANQLFAQERSLTADLPGTTRDWVGEIANIDGLAVMLVDTPGLRETQDNIERQAIQQSGEQIRRADLILLVLDASEPLEQQQRLIEQYPRALRVVNKSDRAGAWDAAGIGGVATIATSGHGVDQLRQQIRAYFGCDDLDSTRPRCWTPRQHGIVLRAASDPAIIEKI